MKNSYIGEIGELSVFRELLKQNFEVYRANSKIQEGWDLVVILEKNQVVRIQVKTTVLENKSTNNSFTLKSGFDYLVLVVIDSSEKFNYYILSNNEVEAFKKGNKQLSVTQKTDGEKKVLSEISKLKDKWHKIKESLNAESQ